VPTVKGLLVFKGLLKKGGRWRGGEGEDKGGIWGSPQHEKEEALVGGLGD